MTEKLPIENQPVQEKKPLPLPIPPRWVVVLAVISVIGIIISILLKFLTPEPASIPISDFITENKDQTTTKFSQIVFKGLPPEPRDSLPIVSISENNTSFSTIREDLFKDYGLVKVSGTDNTWTGEKYFFYYDEIQDNYVLNANFDPLADIYLKNIPGAILAAQDFVGTTFSGIELVAQKNKITYLKGVRHVDEILDSSKANFIKIPFSYVINNIPVYLEHKEVEAITITINAQDEVQRVVFQPYFVTLTPIKEVPLIPFDQVLININNNQASIVSAYELSTGIFSLEEMVSGELTEVSLEYRLDLDNEIGYPFYKFKGNLVNAEGKTIKAEIITPAILVK